VTAPWEPIRLILALIVIDLIGLAPFYLVILSVVSGAFSVLLCWCVPLLVDVFTIPPYLVMLAHRRRAELGDLLADPTNEDAADPAAGDERLGHVLQGFQLGSHGLVVPGLHVAHDDAGNVNKLLPIGVDHALSLARADHLG
jgi:hypothetical protein